MYPPILTAVMFLYLFFGFYDKLGGRQRENKKLCEGFHLGWCRRTMRTGEHLSHTLGCRLDSLTSGLASPSPPLQDPSYCPSAEHEDPTGRGVTNFNNINTISGAPGLEMLYSKLKNVFQISFFTCDR